MSIHTTYRMRWPARLDPAGCRIAMLPSTTLPLSQAVRFGDPKLDDEPGRIAPGVDIADLVPADTPPEDATWSIRDGVLTFAGEILNGHVAPYDDGSDRNRERILLDALAATCGTPDGHVVGAWTSDSLGCDWMPMVWLRGRLLRGFVNGHAGSGYDGAPGHDGRLRIDVLDVDGDVVTVPVEAFVRT